MIKPILTAAILGTTIVSTAWALPVAPANHVEKSGLPAVVQVKDYDNHHGNKHYGKNWHHDNHQWADHRYDNWNRYSSRPYGWQSRGCVLVGPLWFCP
jgi:hypothetical protein